MKLRVLDLFSGIGGISLGLESTGGFETVAFCELEAFPVAVLEERWPGVPIYRDVRELDAKGLAVDVVAGGFPCQDISLAGRGAGIDGARSGLWVEMRRIIDECRPRWVLAENVPALRARGADRVISDLEGLGYTTTAVVVGADHAGAPHRRRRAFLLAYRNGERCEGLGVEGGDAPCERQRESSPGDLADGRGAGELDHADEAGLQGLLGDEPAPEGGRRLADRPAPEAGVCLGARRVADSDGDTLRDVEQRGPGGRTGAVPDEGEAFTRGPRTDLRGDWPARPGEQPREWEAPRLSQRPVGPTADGLPGRVDGSWNRAALKALGNSVVPQVVAALGRSILTVEKTLTASQRRRTI